MPARSAGYRLPSPATRSERTGKQVGTDNRAPNSPTDAAEDPLLSQSRFWSGVAERALIFDLKQVRRYFCEPGIREAAMTRVAAVVEPDTRVLVGHSLGSVVAYEALCAYPEWPVTTLVTLGSPLGIRHLVFSRLRPPPSNDRGNWPGGVSRWVNVVDAGDVVALVKRLASCFGERVEDHLVHNGSRAHDVSRYLTAMETGSAILTGLR